MMVAKIKYTVVIFLFVQVNILFAQTPIITTIAGNGSTGFNGDGGTAIAATLTLPSKIAIDTSGNLYIADTQNGRIRKIDKSTGIITTVAGDGTAGSGGDGGPATSAQFNWAQGIAVDTGASIYIADRSNNNIRKINSYTGIISTIAGTGAQSYGGDGGQATAAYLHWPGSVFVDNLRNSLYIADSYNHRIRKVNMTTGIITTVAGTGVNGYNGDGGLATNAQLNYPGGTLVDSAGNIYIADYSNNRIRKIDNITGIITTLAGTGTAGYTGDGGLAIGAELYSPVDMVFDKGENNMYVAEAANFIIRKINMSNGIITTLAGNGTSGFSGDGGPAASATFNYPTGVCLDAAGNFYITDISNQRIRKVTMSNAIDELAGGALFTIWPNPASTILTIELKVNNTEIRITDALGNILKQENIKVEKIAIDISDLQNGIYFVQVKTNRGAFTKKIIVQR